MKTYFLTLFNTISIDLYNLYIYIPTFILNYLYVIKLEFINFSINFNFYSVNNYYFFIFYFIFIIITTNYIYKLSYNTICYVNFDLIFDIYISLKQLKFFIILNKFEYKFLYYYKTLFQINLKQFLIGTGIFFFYLCIYQVFIISFEFINCSNFICNNSKIYNYNINLNILDFIFQFNYINIFTTLILIYLFLHILFGLFNIFYDYLKDISFILFFLSFFIFFILFNLYLLQTNLELYTNLMNYILK